MGVERMPSLYSDTQKGFIPRHLSTGIIAPCRYALVALAPRADPIV